MSATKKEESTAGPSSAPKVEEKKKLPQLGALEDDDEFEEFSADGELLARRRGIWVHFTWLHLIPHSLLAISALSMCNRRGCRGCRVSLMASYGV